MQLTKTPTPQKRKEAPAKQKDDSSTPSSPQRKKQDVTWGKNETKTFDKEEGSFDDCIMLPQEEFIFDPMAIVQNVSAKKKKAVPSDWMTPHDQDPDFDYGDAIEDTRD